MIPKLPKGFSHPMTVGAGSFSSVYRVRQKALDRWVAIKILPEKNPDLRQALLKEAKTQAQMRIGRIPAVYDAFAWGQQICIVMQWIKGVSLLDLMEGGLPSPDRPAVAAAVVAALASLHGQGFAHRDLKPANILVSPEDGIYLVDFGFSKKIADGERSMSATIKGTPAYMAPELWRPKDEQDLLKVDLFALGKILKQLKPGPEWEPLINSLLAEDPVERPASAAALGKQWETFLASCPSCNWKSLAGPRSSELLSRHLLQAAKKLLLVGKEEEAYWLLTECLEEDPDSTEALRLMESFPAASRKKVRQRKLRVAGMALGFAGALSAAFYFGRQTGSQRLIPATPQGTARMLLLPSRKPPEPFNAGLYLKEFSRGPSRLSGWIFVEDPEACDSLYLDGSALASALTAGEFPVSHGEHQLLCKDFSGNALRKEKVSLLPFQKKVVHMRRVALNDGKE